MKLSRLLAGINYDTTYFDGDIEINDVTTDPNLCKKGVLYVAVESETVDSTRYGVRLDGRNFIDIAIANGASAVLSDANTQNPLAQLGLICSRLFENPRPANLALVTGTNGKTSTVNFARQIWTKLGQKSCSVGNLGGICSDGSSVWNRDPVLSVPETVFMHKMLVDLARNNCDYVAMEATSHALFDYRLHNCKANIGAFSNLTRDHLDFHLTMEEYFRVKMLLFTEVLEPGSFAVLNSDTDHFDAAYKICKSRNDQIITYGQAGKEVQLLEVTKISTGNILDLCVYGKNYQIQFNLFGQFQISNALCALSIALASGMDLDLAVNSLGALTEVEGRLNHVSSMPNGAKIIVDFAHTPDGLQAALEACRSFTMGNLVIVFGSAGDRDQGKRPLMGEIATKLADIVIVTDDSPNSENPALIRKEIISGASDSSKVIEIDDRLAAIRFAASQLGANDTLLLAGLGHETTICKGSKTIPFSDFEAAKQISSEVHI